MRERKKKIKKILIKNISKKSFILKIWKNQNRSSKLRITC